MTMCTGMVDFRCRAWTLWCHHWLFFDTYYRLCFLCRTFLVCYSLWKTSQIRWEFIIFLGLLALKNVWCTNCMRSNANMIICLQHNFISPGVSIVVPLAEWQCGWGLLVDNILTCCLSRHNTATMLSIFFMLLLGVIPLDVSLHLVNICCLHGLCHTCAPLKQSGGETDRREQVVHIKMVAQPLVFCNAVSYNLVPVPKWQQLMGFSAVKCLWQYILVLCIS